MVNPSAREARARTAGSSVALSPGPPRQWLDLPPQAPPPAAPPPTVPDLSRAGRYDPAAVDWALVAKLRDQVAEELSKRLGDDEEALDPAQTQALGQHLIQEALAAHLDESMRAAEQVQDSRRDEALSRAVYDALFRLGRLQHLIDDPEVENVELYGTTVIVERTGGTLDKAPPIADSAAELTSWLQFVAASQGRPFSTANPRVHLRLSGGEHTVRVAAQMPPVAPWPQAMVRKHRLVHVSLADLVALGVMTPDIAQFLAAAVRARQTIIISGAQSSGKTTLLRALCGCLSAWEPIATVETEFELLLHEMPDRHYRVFAHEAVPGSGEIGPHGAPVGQITVGDILPDTLRENRLLVIVGETRSGKDVTAMFDAMAAGAGSASTMHASTAADAVERLVELVTSAGPQYGPDYARRVIGSHVDLIVQLDMLTTSRARDGQPRRDRFISEIVAVERGEQGAVAQTPVYAPGPDGRAAPSLLPAPLRATLERDGGYQYDPLHWGAR